MDTDLLNPIRQQLIIHFHKAINIITVNKSAVYEISGPNCWISGAISTRAKQSMQNATDVQMKSKAPHK